MTANPAVAYVHHKTPEAKMELLWGRGTQVTGDYDE
jgi:hypothetical protein